MHQSFAATAPPQGRGIAGILTFHSAKPWYVPNTVGTFFLCQIPGKGPHPQGLYPILTGRGLIGGN